tara:strand:+ start:1579 stop:1872 length:294 start_codon:yes stop_codon:yes gene_type:complete
MDHITTKEAEKNPMLDELVEPENDLKNMLVEYVGEKLSPEDSGVTVEMIVGVLAEEFPEFVMVLAEENWIRGYHQALEDVETGRAAHEEAMLSDQQE